MNIFRTSDCPIKSAQDHCDIHCRKLLVEVLQLLSTAHVVIDGVQIAYKSTHQNHPSSIWARESKANYRWLWNHAKALSDEYTHFVQERFTQALSILMFLKLSRKASQKRVKPIFAVRCRMNLKSKL